MPQALTDEEAGEHFGELLLLLTCAVALGDQQQIALLDAQIQDDQMLIEAGIDPRERG